MLYGPDNKPLPSVQVIKDDSPTFKVTRQLKRAYLRQCGIATINQLHGPESRKVRKSLGIDKSKNPEFIEEVRNATKAW